MFLSRSKSKKQTAAQDELVATQMLVEGLPRDDPLAALHELSAQDRKSVV